MHRDLKPRNVMVTEPGKVKVADFGISAVLEDTMSRHSLEGTVSGTLSYMSPQQAQGKRPSHLDDIHALGATIYELLTGKPPFFRGNQAAIFHQLLTVTPPSMAERREDLEIVGRDTIPPDWEETVAACLAKDPGQRPQNPGDVLARLRTTPFKTSAALVERTPPPPSLRPKRLRLWWWVLVASVISVPLYLVWQSISNIRNREDNGTKGSTEIESRDQLPTPNPLAKDPAGRPFVNSLGMQFVPVPGTRVLFCTWETRVKDFKAFVSRSGYDMSKGQASFTLESDGWRQAGGDWRDPHFQQSDDEPVVCVSWEDAKAFCAWLSREEGRRYRLPTDHEWSCAAGVGDSEDPTPTPRDKDGKNDGVYLWGRQWPPAEGAGNFADRSRKEIHPEFIAIEGYRDGFANTAPAGAFMANALGIYDLGGNVWEWCEDWFELNKSRVLRGGSFCSYERERLLLSCRYQNAPGYRYASNGFRVVTEE